MFLLDTNVVSELRKVGLGRAHPRVVDWNLRQTTTEIFLSAISVQEIEKGILLLERRDPRQAALMRDWLNGALLPAFDRRILPVDVPVARSCARLHVPDPAPYADSLIAATALVHGLTVATRNAADFRRFGVPLVNPWEG